MLYVVLNGQLIHINTKTRMQKNVRNSCRRGFMYSVRTDIYRLLLYCIFNQSYISCNPIYISTHELRLAIPEGILFNSVNDRKEAPRQIEFGRYL